MAFLSVSQLAARDSAVVFNEAHYHPAGDDTTLEYIELYNQLAVDVDISNWRIDGDIDFDFPEGTIIGPGAYLVVAKDPSALQSETGYSNALGPYNRDLSNSGDPIYLYNNNRSFRTATGSGSVGTATDELTARRIMDELNYSDTYPWPIGSDGSGFSMAKIDPFMATKEASSWKVSTQANGTPGAANAFTALPSIVFNEASSTEAINFEIELYNHGSGPIALGGLVIASSNSLASEYILPSGTLSAGTYLTIDATTLGFTPADNNRLFLYSAGKTTLIDTMRADNNPVARITDSPGKWGRPTTLTIGSTNIVAIEDDIVINEIFYNAKSQIESGGITTTSIPVLDFDSNWRYNLNAGTSGLPAGWEDTAHTVDNVNWAQGPGLLGVEKTSLGESIQTTMTKTSQITYYFETEFTYNGTDSISEIHIQHYIDDGAVFYLNGEELDRYNMDDGIFTHTTLANPGVGNASLQSFIVSSPNVLQGSNRLSVEVHQVTSGSTDFVFGANVILKEENTTNYTPYLERDEEWVELYNRSASPIDLTDWELDGGIGYDFPNGTILASGDYLVVAKDPQALAIKHPSVTIIGDYSNRLGNGGDHIELKDPNNNIADEVRYYEGGKWHGAADGGGSTLELTDPDADNSIAGAWAASDESSRNSWQTYTYEGIAIDDGIGIDTFHELQIGLLDAGELLIDDVSVIENSSLEFIQNGDFESDAVGATADKWRAIGTHGSHGKSVVVTDPDDSNNKCLHLVATGPTGNKHNKLETTFANSEQVVLGNTYTVSFRAKWINGSSQLNTKFYFNYLQKTHSLDTAEIWGTPGSANTALVANAGPNLTNLAHSPVVPDANQAVSVSIDATDPDGIGSFTLFYSINDGAFQSTTMTNTGDRYTGTIPGQSASTIVRFYVQGNDSLGANSYFPANAENGGAFYKVQDGLADNSGLRHNFRFIMSPSDRAFLFLDTNRMSNDRFPVTVIENEETVYYDVQLRLKASAHGRYNNYGFNIRFEPDQLFRGVHDSISIERGVLDKQILSKVLMNRAGGGYWTFYDDVAKLIPSVSNGSGICMLSMSRHTGSYWDGLFPEANESGTLFNHELHYDPNGTTGGPEDLKIGNPFNHTNGRYQLIDRGSDKEPYRWGFQIRSTRDRDDYSQLIALNQAVGNLSGTDLKAALDPMIDVDQWMRTFAMMALNGTDDVYGRIWEHNFRFFVRPTDQKIIILQWDLDRTFRLGASSSLIPTSNGAGTPYPVAKLFQIPEYRRIFDGHLDDLIQTTMNSTYVNSISANLKTAISDNSDFANYITNRANYALTQLSSVAFEITTNGGADFSEPDSAVDITGQGSYNVFSINVNGIPTPVTWTGASTWQITVPIAIGPNALSISAINNHGVDVDSDSITVTNTSDVDLADDSNTIISEFHYNPIGPSIDEENLGYNDDEDFEFIELMNISSGYVDYSNANFTNGITFTIPVGTVLAPGGRLIIVSTRAAFEYRNGAIGVTIAGDFIGKLSNSGERIRLAAADASTIADFTYSDDHPWPKSADGDGYSLVSKGTNTSIYSDWRPSVDIGGNPGSTDTNAYSGGSLIDYAMPSQPTPIPTGGSFFIEFSAYLSADDASFEVEFSPDLSTWHTAETINLISQTNNGDGTATFLYETPIPLTTESSFFGKVIIEGP